MKFDIMTLFPELVGAFLSSSILGRAVKAGFFAFECHNIRDYAEGRHHNVDDTPYGGGAGMLLAAPPVVACFEALTAARENPYERRRVIYLSPRGRRFDQRFAAELATYDHLVLLCGHYEGLDRRAMDAIGAEEVSLGDFVLTGGELPACAVVDAVARLLPGVLAEPACYEEESIAGGLLEYPQYTRPPLFRGAAVPEVLLSGNHKNIRAWRLAESLTLTKERRPDLYDAYRAAHPDPPAKKQRKKKTPAGE